MSPAGQAAGQGLIAGLTWAQVTGLGSLAVTAILAGFSVRRSLRENAEERRKQILDAAGAGAARDSVAVGTTERAVLVLDNALGSLQRQYYRDTEAYRTAVVCSREAHEREIAGLNQQVATQDAHVERLQTELHYTLQDDMMFQSGSSKL